MIETADTLTFKGWLKDRCGDLVTFDEPMNLHTSFKVGGPADIFVRPDTTELACAIITRSREAGIPVFMAGDGTNLVVRDGGIRGLVMVLSEIPPDVSAEELPGGQVLVTAHAGVKTRSICRLAIEKGYRGMNFALGIPGTVGGNIAMNAGTHLGAMEQVVHSIRVLNGSGKLKNLERKDLGFYYRRLYYPNIADSSHTPVIFSASFLLEKGNKEEIETEARDIISRRTGSQPVTLPNAGCIFKNPEGGDPAGKLIDLAGLKGKFKGGAMISDKHANFIVNTGSAKAEDIIYLIDLARNEVFRKFSVVLETEVKIVGA
jgi:UDP-N-acetylmuramate dehydrogenase